LIKGNLELLKKLLGEAKLALSEVEGESYSGSCGKAAEQLSSRKVSSRKEAFKLNCGLLLYCSPDQIFIAQPHRQQTYNIAWQFACQGSIRLPC